jgi:large subunit ribosomal protein L13e
MQVQKPIVKRQYRAFKLIRNGRGYSKGEIQQAGLHNLNSARIYGIPVDIFRKTIHQENIERLKPIVNAVLQSRQVKSSKNESGREGSNKVKKKIKKSDEKKASLRKMKKEIKEQ